MMKRFVLQSIAWAGLVALCGVVSLAQDTASTQAPGARSDGQIEMEVVHALDASSALKSDLITAATIQSEVTLSGTVSSASSRELAESIAAHVAGVTKVNNNLKVGNPQAAADAADQPMTTSESDDSMEPLPPAADGPQTASSPSQYSSQYPNQEQAQYPSQDQAQPQPDQQGRPQYVPANSRTRPQPYEFVSRPVTIPSGMLLQLRTNEPVASKRAQEGTPVEFTVIHDVAVGGVLAIPRGATVHGVVTEVKQTEQGQLTGSSELALRITSLDLGGRNYPLESDQFKVKGPGKGERTAGNVIGGGLLGAMIGGIAGRGPGAAIGAVAGAGVGVAASAASSGPGVWIPSEARVDFHLAAPLTVKPVNEQEAARLAQGLYPSGPTLQQRNNYPYARPYPVYGYPYSYPPVYYRPYYVVGGYYYWR
jgi:hypothetical protein